MTCICIVRHYRIVIKPTNLTAGKDSTHSQHCLPLGSKYFVLISLNSVLLRSILSRLVCKDCLVVGHTFNEIHIPQLKEPSKLVSPVMFNQGQNIPLSHVIVSLRVRGRTGNQLFQGASAAGFASVKNINYWIYGLELGKYFNAQFPHGSTRVLRHIHEEQSFGIYEPLKISEGTVLEGYFQSYKNFRDLDIREAPRFKSTYLQKARKIILEINTTSVNTILGVHVRRGDYTTQAKTAIYPLFPPS